MGATCLTNAFQTGRTTRPAALICHSYEMAIVGGAKIERIGGGESSAATIRDGCCTNTSFIIAGCALLGEDIGNEYTQDYYYLKKIHFKLLNYNRTKYTNHRAYPMQILW